VIKVNQLKKSFGEPPLEVLHGLDFEIADGSFVSVTGRSGSGKSTLLYCMSTLDAPTSGEVFFDGHELGEMSSEELHQFRNEKMGFIFQFHYLLPELTALENVLMPTRKLGLHLKKQDQAKELLTKVGLLDKFHRLPKELSGGEQQRVAIARSLIMNPKYVFADEPTGNLDSVNGDLVMDILKSITRASGTSIIYVTHDLDFAALADKTIQLVDGLIVG
jgi:putative ABC transport system ATP-binding protein/lipoprotein-releasing system ATP-binding protein